MAVAVALSGCVGEMDGVGEKESGDAELEARIEAEILREDLAYREGLAQMVGIMAGEQGESDEIPAPPDGPNQKIVEDLPPSKWEATAKKAMQEMREALATALTLLGDARQKNDEIRLDCLNEKVTKMKARMRISNEADKNLEIAIRDQNVDSGRANLKTIRVNQAKMQELLTQAHNCAGVSAEGVDGSKLDVEIDPTLLDEDPYYGSEDLFYSPDEVLVGGTTGEIGEDSPDVARPPPVSATE
jgi:hypothetical protein